MAGAWARMARLTLSSIPQRLDPILSEVRTSSSLARHRPPMRATVDAVPSAPSVRRRAENGILARDFDQVGAIDAPAAAELRELRELAQTTAALRRPPAALHVQAAPAPGGCSWHSRGIINVSGSSHGRSRTPPRCSRA